MNIRIRCYRLVGRVRILRVPARRLGALIKELSLTHGKSPQETISGLKTNV